MGRQTYLEKEHTRLVQEIAKQMVGVLTMLDFMLKEIIELKDINMMKERKMHETLARNEDACRTPTRQITTGREPRTRSPQMARTPPMRGTTPPNTAAAPNTAEALAEVLSALRRDSTPASLSDQVPAGSPSSPVSVVSLADLADWVALTPKLIETIELIVKHRE